MAQALGLGGMNKADKELRPNADESITQGQIAMAPAAADESWTLSWPSNGAKPRR